MNDRRQFLTTIGVGALAAITGKPTFALPEMPLKRHRPKPPEWFTPIAPSSDDRLIVPPGYDYHVIIKWNDPLGSKAPDGTPEHFGFNNDFNTFFPIDALDGGKSTDEGLLWTNHEYPHPLFVSDFPNAPSADMKSPEYKKWLSHLKTAEQIQREKLSVGGTITHIKRIDGKWTPQIGSKYHRRFTASYPMISFTGPAAKILKEAQGTLANCSGGQTSWHTVITCEENFPDFNNNTQYDYRWKDVPELQIDETKYGWIVEVDPFGVLPPQKHTALGRFKHENLTWRLGKSNKFVAYMGDDEVDQHLYKFVSEMPLDQSAPREQQRRVLEAGKLYAADFSKGTWVLLEWNATTQKQIQTADAYLAAQKLDPTLKIESQADVLIHTRLCAKILGATPLDRCEDCELHPLDRSLYVSLTNNTKHGNMYGHIVRLVEDNDDAEGTKFQYEVFLAGGPQSGLACPDNLAFDRFGNLWVVCDMSSGKLGKPPYSSFKNNGMFVVPTAGENAGHAYQFASGPIQCELTGPWFSPDGSTLFLSVQHPGEETADLNKPTSHWPTGQGLPSPAVVAITGFKK